MGHGKLEHRLIAGPKPHEPAGLWGGMRQPGRPVAGEQIRRHGGDIGEREGQGDQNRSADRERHRREHFALEPQEPGDRRIDGDDDRHAQYDRTANFDRRLRDDLPQLIRAGACAAANRPGPQPAHRVFHDDD